MSVLFVPHGGGPMPLLGDENHRALTQFMRTVGGELPKPKAIVVITAHWEENVATISSSPAPGMFYDYHGFPQEAYEFKYSAPGNPELAENIMRLLQADGIKCKLDSARDFDHGTFVPLMLMYPAADIPVVQISLLNNLDPAAHIALGKALAPLCSQGVLILGSGMSFHNMRAFFTSSPSTRDKSEYFDNWLTETLTNTALTADEQQVRLVNWQSAPEARFCHPREEHLLPLLVCYGAGSALSGHAVKLFDTFLFNTKISAFFWPSQNA
ncbi:MAG: dioxygenase [Gammaproteobacteria bacterium]|nr:MAG: dioxygenase [Gammaproteobacteria bacterium]